MYFYIEMYSSTELHGNSNVECCFDREDSAHKAETRDPRVPCLTISSQSKHDIVYGNQNIFNKERDIQFQTCVHKTLR